MCCADAAQKQCDAAEVYCLPLTPCPFLPPTLPLSLPYFLPFFHSPTLLSFFPSFFLSEVNTSAACITAFNISINCL